MPRVMISYRNVDGQREFALELEKMLSATGIDTWIDVNDIPRLSNWEDEIFKGVINSDYVILCLSPDYFESEICRIECYLARGYGKKLLPLIVPYDSEADIFELIASLEATRGIEHIQYLNFHKKHIVGLPQTDDELFQRLIDTIEQPVSPDIDYDAYISYRLQNGKFATQIADNLNMAKIETFVHSRHIPVGENWRRVSWNAQLKARFHIVVLSPDVVDSEYISNEVLVSRTQHTTFVPVVPLEYANEQSRAEILNRFAADKNLAVLNPIQWFEQEGEFEIFIQELIQAIQEIQNRNS